MKSSFNEGFFFLQIEDAIDILSNGDYPFVTSLLNNDHLLQIGVLCQRSARLSVSVSTISLVSVSVLVWKIHIFLVSVSVSVSNIRELESRSRLLRLISSVSVLVSFVETVPARSWSRTLKTGLADLFFLGPYWVRFKAVLGSH